MQEQQQPQEPRVVQIYGGWQAHGDGWAVFGETEEKARENYWKAVQRHKEILAMPPWYMQVEAQSAQGSQSL
jgi:hypothetical protein